MSRESGEITRGLKKYLKVILDIENSKGIVRVKDISTKLGISMASVSSTLKKLKDMGYIDYEKYDFVRFNLKGKELADKFYYNFSVLYRFFVEVLKVDSDTAMRQADEICIDVLDEVINKMENYLISNL
jgi:DtxR family Mn-dependent transcriptional regulator